MERLTYRGTPQMTEDGLVTPSYSDYSPRRIIEKLAEYEDIGTVEEFKALKEKNDPKKPEYKKMVYPKHKWREENGKIDEFAFCVEYCNGPVCDRCYHSFCEHCNPEGWDEECVVEDYICPACGKSVGYKKAHCDCGQTLDWGKE